uniref:Uncharacterized protein n=1 Tax=Anguilla anguilla TaxID=7936 RepID=A0A0E9WFI3_ANGAN
MLCSLQVVNSPNLRNLNTQERRRRREEGGRMQKLHHARRRGHRFLCMLMLLGYR